MKATFLLMIATCGIIIHSATAGNENSPVGGREWGVGNATVTYTDIWAVNYNQAGLAFLKKITAGAYYDNMFLTNDISTKSFALAIPTKNLGVFAMSINSFGFQLYNEQKYAISYAKTFGPHLAAAVQLDLLSTHIGEDYGTRNVMAAEAGIRCELIKNLWLGAHIFNLNRAGLATYDNEKVPTIVKFGLSYLFSENVILSSEIEKDELLIPMFKAGCEYHIVKPLYLRVGISTNPIINTFGFGLDLNGLKLDFAASFHQELGFSPHTSLVLELK